jgi:hypothetical protein
MRHIVCVVIASGCVSGGGVVVGVELDDKHWFAGPEVEGGFRNVEIVSGLQTGGTKASTAWYGRADFGRLAMVRAPFESAPRTQMIGRAGIGVVIDYLGGGGSFAAGLGLTRGPRNSGWCVDSGHVNTVDVELQLRYVRGWQLVLAAHYLGVDADGECR